MREYRPAGISLTARVFNHYRRIEPLLAPPPAPAPRASTEAIPAPPLPHEDYINWDRPGFDSAYDPNQPQRDATRVVGAEGGSDPTLTHSHVLSREERWGTCHATGTTSTDPEARGDGYFSSLRPPTLLGKVAEQDDAMPHQAEPEKPARGRRRKSTDEDQRSANELSEEETRLEKARQEEARAAEEARLEEEAQAKYAAAVKSTIQGTATQEDPHVVVEKSNVLMM